MSYSSKNSLKVFVSNKSEPCSPGTTLKTLAIGEIGFFNEETGALVGSNASGIGAGIFAWRKANGQVEKSKSFTFTGWAATLKAYAAPTMCTQYVDIASVTVGETYQITVEMKIPGMGGNYIKHGNYVAVTGDTTTTVATALALSINNSFARESKSYFTITSSTNRITVVAKLLDYVRGKKQGRPAWFKLSVSLPTAIAVIGTQSVAPSDGIGYGPYICEKEFLAQGDQDNLRFSGYPNSFDDRALVALSTGTYNVVAVTVDDVVKTANADVRALQQYLICFNDTGATPIPIVNAAINDATDVTGHASPGATVALAVNGSVTDTVTADGTTGVWTASQTVSTGQVLTATALLANGTISANSVAVTVTAS
jgi:hypothetical protein